MLHEMQVHQIELELQNEELRRAQLSLEESRARYFELYDQAPVAYVTVSEPGLILEANLAACTLLGGARGALVRQLFSRFIRKADQDIWYLQRKQLFATGAQQTFELRLERLDGLSCWVQLAATTARDTGGTSVGRIVLTDLTTRKQMEEALRNHDARHTKMVANISDVIVIIDHEGRTRYRSPNVEKLFGWSPEESMGRDATENVHPDDLDSLSKFVRALQGEPNATGTIEVRYRRKDGSYCWIELTGINLLHDPDIRGLLGSFRDITERKQIETLNQQLQKSESLGQMAGGIAHHFNNKLQTVILSLELAKASPTQNPALVESLLIAIQASHEAAEVSTLLLTYLGQSQVKYEPLDISDLCLAGLPLLRAAMPTDIDLVTDLPAPGPVISANADQIRRVLSSLMTNAWEAKGEGPNHLRLGIKTVTAADIPVTRRLPLGFQIQETAYACLEVADTGSGITAKNMEKLFDPFFSSKFAGRGLGLPVVLGIVRSHQGAITVESEPGRGSIFRVFFPVVADAVLPPRQAPGEPVAENLRRGTTVLVVEDDKNLRDTLVLVLEFSDYTVLTAEDGIAAVEVFRQHRDEIGCVLCDVIMPRMNGWETLTALRQLAPGLPVILLSGHSEDEIKAGDHAERPQAFFRKPYDLQVLLKALNQCLDNKKK